MKVRGPIAHAALPQPDATARQHSARVEAALRAAMVPDAISFARYMALCLHEPGLGYYSVGAVKFGAEGDYVTAPEWGPLYGQCLSQACAEVLSALPSASILEFGAGSGALAVTLLQTLAQDGPLPAEYLILEPSAALRIRQQRAVASLVPEVAARVRWLDHLPTTLIGVVLANEVLDAMPVQRLRITPHGVEELCVRAEGAGFVWAARAPSSELGMAIGAVEAGLDAPLAPGYVTEINAWITPWIAGLAAMLRQGVLLLIDYGYGRREYYHPERVTGTLRCHYRHHAHDDPFLYPGLQDITAHVDFSAVAQAAQAAGLDLLGYTTQADFLLGCGLERRLRAAHEAGGAEWPRYAAQAQHLLHPGAMGEMFKVMLLGRRMHPLLTCLGTRDARHRL